MHEQAFPVAEIVKQTGFSEGLVRRLIREHQDVLEAEYAHQVKLRGQPDLVTRKARKMRAAGLTVRQIAERLGVSEKKASACLRDAKNDDGPARVMERGR